MPRCGNVQRGICRVEILAVLQHFQMDVRFLGTFTADGAHGAQLLPSGHGVAGFHGGAVHPAHPPQAAGSIFQRDHAAPPAVGAGLGHLAGAGGTHRTALGTGVIHTVVGAPVAQRLAVDQLVTTVGVEHPARERLRGGRRG